MDLYFQLLALIIIFLFGFLYFRNKKQKEQAILNQKAAELSRQVAENDMKALRSQMNPHFIFNCVQTVERLLNDSKINESKTCLMQFSNLTRRVLENSKKGKYHLQKNYRPSVFTWIWKMPGSVCHLHMIFLLKLALIPKLLTAATYPATFVENSIKHGFHGLDKPGEISIEVKKRKRVAGLYLKR